jgi:hypothetical protein
LGRCCGLTDRLPKAYQSWLIPDRATRRRACLSKTAHSPEREPTPTANSSSFTRREVALEDGKNPDPLVIRASPHIVIEARYFDGNGKPAKGYWGHIFGWIDGGYWIGEANVGQSGKLVALVPRWLWDAKLHLIADAHDAIKWRKSADEQGSRSRTITLGWLDHDVKGIEVFRACSHGVCRSSSRREGIPAKQSANS